MRNKWYSDNRDLVKWSTLIHLAQENNAKHILQIAYFRHDNFSSIEIDGEKAEIPPVVKSHFRDTKGIKNLTQHTGIAIHIFDKVFEERKDYQNQAIDFIKSFANRKCIVFLDPDTGLEPSAHSNLNHALEEEVNQIWDTLKSDDVLVFYQHQTNRKGDPWIEPKRLQLIRALGVPKGLVKIAQGDKIASDVVLFYATKI